MAEGSKVESKLRAEILAGFKSRLQHRQWMGKARVDAKLMEYNLAYFEGSPNLSRFTAQVKSVNDLLDEEQGKIDSKSIEYRPDRDRNEVKDVGMIKGGAGQGKPENPPDSDRIDSRTTELDNRDTSDKSPRLQEQAERPNIAKNQSAEPPTNLPAAALHRGNKREGKLIVLDAR